MGPGLIALFLAVGVGVWIYSKFMRTTGSNTQTSVIAAGAAGILLFLVAYFIFKAIGG